MVEQSWKLVIRRRGTKGMLATQLAVRRVRVADGSAQRMHDKRGQHLPGEEVSLVGEHRSTGERKYCLSNLAADTPIQDTCRQHQGVLGLRARTPATEGGTWPRLLCGPVLGRFAPTRLDNDDRKRLPAIPTPLRRMTEKNEPRSTTTTEHAGRQAVIDHLARPPPTRFPHCNEPIVAAPKIQNSKVLLGHVDRGIK